MDITTIYIGWDSKQQTASQVCEYSIRKHASKPVRIIHLKKQDLIENNSYFRPDGDPSSTEFTYARFLVPYLENYKGNAFFVDSDFVFTSDICSLSEEINKRMENHSVFVTKHKDYVPKNNIKFYGEEQLTFPKKNWSSLMYFNCGHTDCKNLTPMSISNSTPQWLHRFNWTTDNNIGHIPITWNWLVGEYGNSIDNPNGLHFTNGGPFNDVHGQDYENVWLTYYYESLQE